MNLHNIDTPIAVLPPLDPGYIPIIAYIDAFQDSVARNGGMPIAIAVHRNAGLVSVYRTQIHSDEAFAAANALFVERLVKSLLWLKGGYRVVVHGAPAIAERLQAAYREGGARAFDASFMADVYGHPFVVESAALADAPEANEPGQKVGGNLDGCRIGFDAGGSDRKVSAVIDGEVVYSEEVVWHPKLQTDPSYHYDGITSALQTAASKMPRVDAIGISSAGIYIDNECKVASLFLKVPRDAFEREVRDIYIRAAKAIGDVPFLVYNDGDVAALAGAMELHDNDVLGIAMGTSEAAGYVDAEGRIKGWLNELAFAPVDLNPDAMIDEWSGDAGVGCKYFSQDAVIKLAPAAGIDLPAETSLAEKLKFVQALMAQNDERAANIFRSIGVYLGYSVAFYHQFYGMKHVLLLGRVMSGEGGNIIRETALSVMQTQYPAIASAVQIHLPDENSRRVGQSVAAAGLPVLSDGNHV